MSIEVLIPPYLQPQSESSTLVDDTTAVFRPQQASGLPQRNLMVEPRIRVKQSFKNLSGSDRGVLLSSLRRALGRFGTIRAVVGYSRRGVFPSTELFTNSTFNGTTGWTPGSASALTVNDRTLRLTYTGGSNPSVSQAVSFVTNAPYVLRVYYNDGRGSLRATMASIVRLVSNVEGTLSSSNGLNIVASVVDGTTGTQYLAYTSSTPPNLAGDYTDIHYASLTRCALVDNASNLVLRSDEFDNVAWTKTNSTVTANGTIAPDATTTGDILLENVTNGQHALSQTFACPSVINDVAVSVAFKASNRSFAQIQLQEQLGSTIASAYFNLSGSGSVGTLTTGANWSNTRAFVKPLGSGWILCTIVSRKVNLATSVNVLLNSASADGTNSYAGVAASAAVSVWRATASLSSVPTQLVQTTSAAVVGANQSGSAIFVKGLPVLTNGLLLNDDLIEINGELKSVTAALDSDAVGCGYLQFAPALFRSPSDNDPIIVQQPMSKFLLASDSNWMNNLGAYADIDIELESIYE